MRNDGNPSNTGNTKKFLYSGPKKEDQEEQWTFSPRKQQASPRETQFGVDDVWSIQKNVSLGKNIKPSTDGLNLKANNTYYSRYGNVKGKDDLTSNFGGSNFKVGNENQFGSTANSTNKSWNYEKRGFSYSSFGTANNGMNSYNGTPNSTKNSPPFSPFGNARGNQDSSLW
ncbi:uncharacterized protein LOC127725292 isoform X3 [Mytilus californianus]|uniref:uncharacterized protein LOC127725292 isoform X3 n=1 Tax=Mytilus californianus TaxID=6549 RepID=UPI002246D442|nr:uncharacterized protein LOC127725292 isoform X3 [Mytilus californianus]